VTGVQTCALPICYEGQHVGEGAAHGGGGDGADDGYAGDGVGAGHERRVQLRGHLLDELEAEEDREHEHEQEKEDGHALASRAALTRWSRTTPSCVSRQPPTISSGSPSLRSLASASQACSMRL